MANGDWDRLFADYTDDMVFVMPGQDDVLNGRQSFRDMLNNLGDGLPPGFEILSIRQIGEVVSVINWKSDKVPGGSQLAVLFRFVGEKVQEERWFIDTEQWKAAFQTNDSSAAAPLGTAAHSGKNPNLRLLDSGVFESPSKAFVNR